MKILLGGVPLGCDNIGDEAIIASVVTLLRKIAPEAELTVCTRDRENTARLLGVKTAPLYGFPPQLDLQAFGREVRQHDVYIWFGATGLSDYPERGVGLLNAARKAGVKTVVWGVGMNSALNPVFYRAAGKRLKLLRLMTLCSFSLADWVAVYENFLLRRTQKHIRLALESCALVVLRDEESVSEVKKCGFTHAVTGADTAILMQSAEPPLKPAPGQLRIGFCISAQSVVRNLDGVKELWRSLLAERPDFRIVLIPMNPVTDRNLMLELAAGLEPADRIECLDSASPAVVQACAGQCHFVVTSRLHLLILASNAGVPGLGIERGSKIANWLKAFGRAPSGSVDDCDFSVLKRQILELAGLPADSLREQTLEVTRTMHERLDRAAELLRQVLNETARRDQK